jgi:hypothetical protein
MVACICHPSYVGGVNRGVKVSPGQPRE